MVWWCLVLTQPGPVLLLCQLSQYGQNCLFFYIEKSPDYYCHVDNLQGWVSRLSDKKQ